MVEIIAEAGVNHNGSLDMALELVDQAAECGADVVKFQTFNPRALVSNHAPKAEYQKRTTGHDESQLEMLNRLALDTHAHHQIMAHCKSRNIEFLSSPFDSGSADLLIDELGVRRIKLGSGELTNGPLLLHVAQKGVPVILSTGMATMNEVYQALEVIAFGYLNPHATPEANELSLAFTSCEGQQLLRERATLLHCTTEYPCPVEDVNLRAMQTLADQTGLSVGYSDHTRGTLIASTAAALGATLLEKHFTLDNNLPGPDHQASLEPGDFMEMVNRVRQIEKALGNAEKAPAASELGNLPLARRSLVAARTIRAGEVFNVDNLAVKRPAAGISPMQYWDLLGTKADRDYAEDEVIGTCMNR